MPGKRVSLDPAPDHVVENRRDGVELGQRVTALTPADYLWRVEQIGRGGTVVRWH